MNCHEWRRTHRVDALLLVSLPCLCFLVHSAVPCCKDGAEFSFYGQWTVVTFEASGVVVLVETRV